MTATICYRVQPVGLTIDGHRSETSNENLACGPHVFEALGDLCHGVQWWCDHDWQPEILEIECDSADVLENGDYEGFVLRGGRGNVVRRRKFRNWKALIAWARTDPETL